MVFVSPILNKLPSVWGVQLPKLTDEANGALHSLAARENYWSIYNLDVKCSSSRVWIFFGNEGSVCLICNTNIGYNSSDFDMHGIKHLKEHKLLAFL